MIGIGQEAGAFEFRSAGKAISTLSILRILLALLASFSVFILIFKVCECEFSIKGFVGREYFLLAWLRGSCFALGLTYPYPSPAKIRPLV